MKTIAAIDVSKKLIALIIFMERMTLPYLEKQLMIHVFTYVWESFFGNWKFGNYHESATL